MANKTTQATMPKVERRVSGVCREERAGLEHREGTGKRHEGLAKLCMPVKALGALHPRIYKTFRLYTYIYSVRLVSVHY